MTLSAGSDLCGRQSPFRRELQPRVGDAPPFGFVHDGAIVQVTPSLLELTIQIVDAEGTEPGAAPLGVNGTVAFMTPDTAHISRSAAGQCRVIHTATHVVARV